MLTVRTFYYKVADMRGAVDWWSKVFDITPHKNNESYSEFKFDNVRVGFVHNDWGEKRILGASQDLLRYFWSEAIRNIQKVYSACKAKYEGNRGVVMLNCDSESERDTFVEKAVALGGKILADNRGADLASVTIVDPFGNEFELGSLSHD
jgi:predicted enzyme related to lactoylglutathione lyase